MHQAKEIIVSKRQLARWRLELRQIKQRFNNFSRKPVVIDDEFNRQKVKQLLRQWRTCPTDTWEAPGGVKRSSRQRKISYNQPCHQTSLNSLDRRYNDLKLEMVSHFINDYLADPLICIDTSRVSFYRSNRHGRQLLEAYCFYEKDLALSREARALGIEVDMPEPHGHLVVDFDNPSIYWRPLEEERGAHNFHRLELRLID